jgi:phospholipid/cholesterol/gamma-HCH transport system permease protein
MLEQPHHRRPPLQALQAWLLGWWQLIELSARLGVLALSPSSYRRAQRPLLLRACYRSTWPLLLPFGLMSSITALLIIRIVLATAASYGLSRYALDLLVRTLVLELIPLSAALYAAVRVSMPAGARLRGERPQHKAWRAAGQDPLRDRVLPEALASLFAAVTLTLVSSLITLVLTYLSVYGFGSWGLAGFTRSVGQIFTPVIVLIFLIKTLLLSLAVAIIPMLPTLREQSQAAAPGGGDIGRLARLLAVVLLIELLSLVGNYY